MGYFALSFVVMWLAVRVPTQQAIGHCVLLLRQALDSQDTPHTPRLQTITSLWRPEDATHQISATAFPTQ